jgi:pimeloyl-ACP methyl ester carboxylesterase
VNHGHSSNSPRDEEEPDRADELEAVLTALGIERPIIAGNSMGGNTLLRWAIRHPNEARALIPSGSGVAREGTNTPRLPGQPIDPDTLFLPIGDSLTDGFKQQQPRMYERYLRIRSTATRIEALRNPRKPSARTLQERSQMASGVAGITSPMLVVVGSLDAAVPSAEHLHELLPQTQLRVIEGAPHNVYYEAAEEYNTSVAAFLDGVLAPA